MRSTTKTSALHWPTVATRILINFLSKLLSGSNDTISRRVFSSLAVEDVYESSIVQQCRMLESKLGTHVLAKCLSDPENAPDAVRSCKESILRSDLTILISTSSDCPSSAAPAALIASHTSWRRLWDVALDKGVKGTRAFQSLFKERCRPSACFKCSLCDCDVPLNTSCLEHVCEAHPDITNISYEHLLSLLGSADSTDSMDSFFNLSKTLSNTHTLWSVKSTQI